MPTLIEYLSVVPGRLFLLSEGYTLHCPTTGDYINVEKLKVFKNIDMERLLPLFNENIEWTIADERATWDAALRAMLTALAAEAAIKYECDQNPDVYIALVSTEAGTIFKFYNKSDDTESNYDFISDHFTMNCWLEYTPEVIPA